MDLDHFKSLNDSHGHAEGDQTLVDVVEVINSRKRQLDFVFRSGGDEFTLLARNTSMASALFFAEQLRSEVESSFSGVRGGVTLSMGVAEYRLDETMEDWMRQADLCLYESKRHGRNMVWPRPENENHVVLEEGC
ncbi:MAG: GGDEF domain-containing protein [Candidatus Thiodiazotropha sp.]